MNTTFIIPIRVESPDRKRNITASVRYLLRNTEGKIIIKEVSSNSLIPEILSEEIKNERVRYVFEQYAGPFHRTKYLNDMLEMVDTPVVSNYDADVILHPKAYEVCESGLLSGHADVIYPYADSETGQVRLYLDSEVESNFLRDSTMSSLRGCRSQVWKAHAGFCFFIRKDDYISCGAEIESFVSYGPEDVERLQRFQKFGLDVKRLTGQVYHMEHARTPDSDLRNPYTEFNWRVYEMLNSMKSCDIAEYLNTLAYVNSRGWKVRSMI